MPLLSKTTNFMLGVATVMLGPTEDLWDLTPAEHSIGLVKNYQMTSEPAYTELTQGIKNTIVFSTMTSNPVRASMEVYEYTAKNLLYGLGLDGSAAAPNTVMGTTASEVDGSSTPEDEVPLGTGEGSTFAQGDTVMIDVGADDNCIIRKVASIATDTLTLDKPVALVIPAGTKVYKVHAIDVGSKEEQPFLGAKIAGRLADGTPIVVLIPKVRITRGFTMAFGTENYGNLPFEFQVYDLVTTDDHYDDFGNIPARIYRQ